MLLTITYEGSNTQDLGYLLFKNPDRPQAFSLSFGKAYVFYPEVSDERTTAALLLDIDPLDLAKGKEGSGIPGLFDYVNDRPYAATSFLSTAISRVFGTAMSGRCDECPALAETPLQLTATLPCLKDRGDEELAQKLFAPLGYTVEVKRDLLTDAFPAWGMSPYITLTIRGQVTLSALLNHLYVLVPVFDRQKHYFSTSDEIQKLLDHGEGWLASHPERERITRRYLFKQRGLANEAIDRLRQGDEAEQPESEDGNEDNEERASGESDDAPTEQDKPVPLNTLRMEAVLQAVRDSGAASVLDAGCGGGKLTALLLKEPQIQKIAACDVSMPTLERASRRLRLDRLPAAQRERITLFQASLTYRDKRLDGMDCACVVEVLEHIEPGRLPALEKNLFGFAAPRTVILTTPNREYNVLYPTLPAGQLRHWDHRFEWTRQEFAAWTERVSAAYGYTAVVRGIGAADENYGCPTQMVVFTKHGSD